MKYVFGTICLLLLMTACANPLPHATETTPSDTSPANLEVSVGLSVTSPVDPISPFKSHPELPPELTISLTFFVNETFVHFVRGESVICDGTALTFSGHDFTSGKVPALGPDTLHTCEYTSPSAHVLFSLRELPVPGLLSPQPASAVQRQANTAIRYSAGQSDKVSITASDLNNRKNTVTSIATDSGSTTLNTTTLSPGDGALALSRSANYSIASAFKKCRVNSSASTEYYVQWG